MLGTATTLPQSALAGQNFCPPGLAKKGCVPPGQQKFRHGDYIPHHVHYNDFDYRHHGLPHPKHGRRYIRIGEDVYLIAEATQRVIEAINLLDAAGR
ncbi:MAG: RcnB family protein [Rhodovibrionaceae bacterium]